MQAGEGRAGAGQAERALACVLFPGVVRSEARALACLGGLRNLSQVYSASTKKRLGLSFCPENPHVKKTYGDLHKTAGLLLKIRIRIKKSSEGVKREMVSTSVVGRISQIYKFDSLFDFQYLPATINNSEQEAKCVFEQIIPSGLDTFDWIREPAESFIVPAHFTRADRAQDYRYSDKKYLNKEIPVNDDVHIRVRPERTSNCAFISFSLTDEIPLKPNPLVVQFLEARIAVFPALKKDVELITKKFEERPIWSKNSLQFFTKVNSNTLKIILPVIALNFRNGPWRMLWVRFGYDPRKDPSARIYQSFDYRLRSFAGINTMVEGRSTQVYHRKVGQVRTFSHRNLFCELNSDEVPESNAIFRPGIMPAQRQIFYQYCDLRVPEVEDMFSRLPDVLPGTLCHLHRGWLPAGLDAQCREILFRYSKQAMLDNHKDSDEVKFAEGSNDSEEDLDHNSEGEPDEFIIPDMIE